MLGACVAGTAGIGTPGTSQSQSFNAHAFTLNDTSNGFASWGQYDTRINLAKGSSDTLNNTTGGPLTSWVALEVLALGQAPFVPGPSPRTWTGG